MDMDNEQVERLREFGLPTYAVRAYLALLKLGTAEARHVSEVARIPPAKVYGTLDQLQQKGLVTVATGKPRKYSPVPMGDFLERRLRDHREQMDALAARKDDLVELFPILGTVEAGGRASISTIRGRRNISEHFRENAAAATRDLALLLPASPSERLRAVVKVLDKARGRGVSIRILAHANADPGDLPPGLQAFPDEFRVSRDLGLEPDVAVATFDGESALLAHFVPGETARDHAQDVAILTKDPALAATLARMVHLCWLQAGQGEEVPEAPTSDAELPGLVRMLHEAVVVTDAEDRIALWSQGAATAFDVAEASALGRPLQAILPGLDEAVAQGDARILVGGRAFVVSCDHVGSPSGSRLRLFRLEAADARRHTLQPARMRLGVPVAAPAGDNDKASQMHAHRPHAALGEGRDDTYPNERHLR